jgi:hypothetical protein
MLTGVQESADVAVAPPKPTCFHLVDPNQLFTDREERTFMDSPVARVPVPVGPGL